MCNFKYTLNFINKYIHYLSTLYAKIYITCKNSNFKNHIYMIININNIKYNLNIVGINIR